MKTYKCGCGNSVEVERHPPYICRRCGKPFVIMHGIYHGGGGCEIWRDGVQAWSGSAFEAVLELERRLNAEAEAKS